MDGKTISPVDVLFNGPRSDFLPETRSKLRSINSIIDKLKKHKSIPLEAQSIIQDDTLRTSKNSKPCN